MKGLLIVLLSSALMGCSFEAVSEGDKQGTSAIPETIQEVSPTENSSKDHPRFVLSGSPVFIQEAGKAVAEWRDVCHLDIQVVSKGYPIIGVEQLPEDWTAKNTDNTTYEGLHYSDKILIVESGDENYLRNTIAHEIGHYLGLKHREEYGMIMSPEIAHPSRHVEAVDCP